MKESLVINKIKKICDEMDIDFYRVHAGQYQSKGMFDCYLVFDRYPHGVWVEIKMSGGKLTELQKDFFKNEHFCLVIKIDKTGAIRMKYNQFCFKDGLIFYKCNLFMAFIEKVENMKFQVRK